MIGEGSGRIMEPFVIMFICGFVGLYGLKRPIIRQNCVFITVLSDYLDFSQFCFTSSVFVL